MQTLSITRMRDHKISQLQSGQTVYAESSELIRLIQRDITRKHLNVDYEQTDAGCWFTPVKMHQDS